MRSFDSSAATVVVVGMNKTGGVRARLFPLLLIALGTLFLLANLGVLPLDGVREMFSTWWPLIPIGVGVAALSGRHGGGGCRMRRMRASEQRAS